MKKKRVWNIGIMFAAMVFCLSNVAFSQVVEKFTSGKIDWEEGYVYGEAVGSADMSKMKSDTQAEEVAKRTAKLLAARNIIETMEGIRLDSKTILRTANEEDDILKAESEGLVKGAVIYEQNVSWVQGSKGREPRASIILRVPIDGNLSRAVAGWNDRQQKTKTLPVMFEAEVSASPAKYTGLIIDGSGIGLKPALAPKILVDDSKKSMVYGPGIVDSSIALVKSITGIAGSLEMAKKNERVGDNPLIIKANRSDGVNGADMIISKKDAEQIVSADKETNFLKNCRVVIVMN